MEDYQLSNILEGHELDVRCICPFPSVPEIGKFLYLYVQYMIKCNG